MPDDTIAEYFKHCMATAKGASGSRAAFSDALRVIADSRNSKILRALADNPDGPMLKESGSEDVPVGKLPLLLLWVSSQLLFACFSSVYEMQNPAKTYYEVQDLITLAIPAI